MTAPPPIFTADEVRAAVSIDDALNSARAAFLALHQETVESPTPWHLDVAEHGGELHVKGAVLQEGPTSRSSSRPASRATPLRDCPPPTG